MLGLPQLVVRYVDERALGLVSVGQRREAVPERAARMLHGKRANVESAVQRDAVGELFDIDRRRQLVERDGEDDGGHLVADDEADALLQRLRAPDREVIALLEDRREE